MLDHEFEYAHNSVIFSLKNQVGGLARALQVFQDLGVNVLHIESRASGRKVSECYNSRESTCFFFFFLSSHFDAQETRVKTLKTI